MSANSSIFFVKPTLHSFNLLNLKLVSLMSVAGLSAATGLGITAYRDKDEASSFWSQSFETITAAKDAIQPHLLKVSEGANNLGTGLSDILGKYNENKDAIHGWIKDNAKFSKVREGWGFVSATLPGLVDGTWNASKESIPKIPGFVNSALTRDSINSGGIEFRDNFVSTVKTLFNHLTSAEGLKKLLTVIKSVGNKDTLKNLSALSSAYSKLKTAFTGMSNDEFSEAIGFLLSNPEQFQSVMESFKNKSKTKDEVMTAIREKNPRNPGKVLGKILTTLFEIFKKIQNSTLNGVSGQT